METRALLVEFVIVDRFHCGISFPYFQGILKENEIKTLNIKFGLKAAEAMLSEDDGTTLSSKDLNNLLEICNKFNPTHILFSHKPTKSIIRTILKFSDKFEIAYDIDSTYIQPISKNTDKTFSFQWFHIPSNPISIDILAFEKPDFTSYPMNKNAKDFRHLPFLTYGTGCNYNKPINKNSYFKNLNLSECIRQTGCTFCMRHPTFYKKENSFNKLKTQLQQAYKTCNWGKHKARYRMVGENIFHKLEKFAKIVDEIDLKNSDFLFDARADYIVKSKTELEKALKILKKNQNRFQLCLVGIENFSPVELERMNKGIKTETIIKMVEILRTLKKKYPNAFDYQEYGGFSTILYTPWTTLEDIEFNLAMILHLKLENLCGKLLTSRLRLYPELPLTKLAERDGLLIDKYDDVLFNTSKRNFYPEEVPWQFKEPKMKIFNQIAARLVNDNSLANDELYKSIQQWYRKLPIENKTPVYIAKFVLEEIKYGKETKNIKQILNTIHNNMHKPDKIYPGTKFSFSMPESEYILIKKNLKQVGRIENVPIQETNFISTKLQKIFGASFKIEHVYQLKYHAEKDVCDIFYGFDMQAIHTAVNLTKFFQQSMNITETAKAIEQLGILLGYPECCSKKYAMLTEDLRHYNEWIHLYNRVMQRGEVLPELNPFTIPYQYIPCSLNCENTVNLFRLLLKEIVRLRSEKQTEEIGALHGKITVEKIIEECKKPLFFLLDTPACCVKLNPLTQPSDTFKYTAVEKFGSDKRLEYVMQGNIMKIGKGSVSIYSNKKKLYDFILNAYVWWYMKPFHPEFWKLCVENLHKQNSLQLFKKKETIKSFRKMADKDVNKYYSESLTDLENFLTKTHKIIKLKTGFKIKDLVHIEQREIQILLTNSQEKIQLIIEPVEIADKPFMRGQYYAVSHKIYTPIISQEATETVKFILRFIDAFKAKQRQTETVKTDSN